MDRENRSAWCRWTTNASYFIYARISASGGRANSNRMGHTIWEKRRSKPVFGGIGSMANGLKAFDLNRAELYRIFDVAARACECEMQETGDCVTKGGAGGNWNWLAITVSLYFLNWFSCFVSTMSIWCLLSFGVNVHILVLSIVTGKRLGITFECGLLTSYTLSELLTILGWWCIVQSYWTIDGWMNFQAWSSTNIKWTKLEVWNLVNVLHMHLSRFCLHKQFSTVGCRCEARSRNCYSALENIIVAFGVCCVSLVKHLNDR